MLRLIQGLVGLAAVLFCLAAVVLLWLNPSSKIKQQAVSIAAAAAVTAFLSTFLALKEEKRDDAFVSTLFWDKATNHPAYIRPPAVQRREHLSLEMARVVGLAKEHGLSLPAERFEASAELLQYMILRELSDRFGDRWSIEPVDVRGGGGTMQIRLSRRLRDAEPQQVITSEALAVALKANPYRAAQEPLKLVVPPGTSVNLESCSTAPSATPSRCAIVIAKPLFFEVRILLTPQAGGGDMAGVDPKAFGLDDQQLQSLRTYPVLVELHARFERLTSENPETEYYKIWADKVFGVVKASFADP